MLIHTFDTSMLYKIKKSKMSGIYFHIPYCKQACHYCDFHFSTNRSTQTAVVEAMRIELKKRMDFLSNPVETIYFGGGTPSLLTDRELNLLLTDTKAIFDVLPQAEITLEVNPDDVTPEKLTTWKKSGINRLSIGVQTFHQLFLQAMNRAHDSRQAQKSIELAKLHGFENINIDLIYGMPDQTIDQLIADLNKIIDLAPTHVAAYCLTIEEKTVFGNYLKNGKLTPLPDDQAADFFMLVSQMLTQYGYDHYEISNFGLPGYYSRHNTAYWQNKPYLGIGAGAHSFDGKQTRHYNISHNQKYIQQILQDIFPCEVEILSPANQINEYIMTSLRTQWGCSTNYLQENYRYDILQKKEEIIKKYLLSNHLFIDNQYIKLTPKGRLLADLIASELFVG